eukprot:10953477-Ditylum_brightwellii.AAC.1
MRKSKPTFFSPRCIKFITVGFDANGIAIYTSTTPTIAAGTTTASNVSSSSTNQKYDGNNIVLEELAPSLAESLAIYCHGCDKDDNNDHEEQEKKNRKADKGE